MWHTLLVLAWCGIATGQLTPTLRLKQGALRGWAAPSHDSYYSIPYATAKRFQAPEPAPSWEGVLMALRAGPACAQALYPISMGREDCLYLDVHAPREPPLPSHPVMVFLHGGAYYHGMKAHYGPAYLVRRGVVVVVPNYRLGVFGFLCVGNIANLGLKDQVAALRWVRDNIAKFGGDPANVTLFGQSAGAAAVGLHMLSPTSADLFHKAILMSGSPLAPWALNPEPIIPAKIDARKLGSNIEDPQKIIETFEKASLSDLIAATWDTSIDTRYFKYSPCVENSTTSKEPFLTEAPYDVFESGRYNKVPTIIGFTNIEGLLFYGLNSERDIEEMDRKFLRKLPAVFEQCSELDKMNISLRLRKHYFQSRSLKANPVGVVRYYSDWVAQSSASAFAELLARTSYRSVYNYLFSYEGRRNYAKFVFGRNLKMKGATHSDDILYLFEPLGLSLPMSREDALFVDRITTMWTNFAKTGNPTPHVSRLLPVRWPAAPAAAHEPIQILRLDRELEVTTLPKKNKAPLWESLLCTYGRKGYVPCHSQDLCGKD